MFENLKQNDELKIVQSFEYTQTELDKANAQHDESLKAFNEFTKEKSEEKKKAHQKKYQDLQRESHKTF